VASDAEQLSAVVVALERFHGTTGLTRRLSELEHQLSHADQNAVTQGLAAAGIDADLLAGALQIKRLAGQINVVVHALGILLALPSILEPTEIVEEMSLGAGNTGRAFDLTTSHRIAEFKFIAWKGGPEAIRQNGLFVDLYHLAEAETDKRREMYLTELKRPLAFLNGRRALGSVLSRNGSVQKEFFDRYGDRYKVVRDYWADIRHRVTLVDASEHLAALREVGTIEELP
jgi:hypothetical protein